MFYHELQFGNALASSKQPVYSILSSQVHLKTSYSLYWVQEQWKSAGLLHETTPGMDSLRIFKSYASPRVTGVLSTLILLLIDLHPLIQLKMSFHTHHTTAVC